MGRTNRRTQSANRLNTVLRAGDVGSSDETGADENSGTRPEVTGVGRVAPEWLSGPPERPVTAMSSYLPERWRRARVDPGRRGAVALAAVGVVVVIIAGVSVLRDAPAVAPVPPLPVVRPVDDATDPPLSTDPDEPMVSTDSAIIVVSVVGLVTRSGLVELPAGSRIADALAAAGGTSVGADVLALNLAAHVEDGDQILVGVAAPDAPPRPSGTVSRNGTVPVASGGAGESTPAPGPDGRIDLNAGTVSDFDALPGVGPVTAAAIVSWRDVNGKFASVEQLGEVDGIGPVRLDKLRDKVFV